MALRVTCLCFALLSVANFFSGCASSPQIVGGRIDVRAFGAKGDGRTLDTEAINNAISAANSAGGGTVVFSAGTYLAHSIHLKSNVTLYLDQGSTLLAAPPADVESSAPSYDAPELNKWDAYEDFGHSHWHNSLIWGENLENIAILGPGRIDGSKGLVRRQGPPGEGVGPQHFTPAPPPSTGPSTGPSTAASTAASTEPSPAPLTTETIYPNSHDTLRAGLGNKAIALKLCRNVILRDFQIYAGGHFAILATGVDNLTIDNLQIDTNRDGIDADCCRNVRVSNCAVNSPFDDGICLKASYGLGFSKPTENVAITNCLVSGYTVGTLLDGTCDPFPAGMEPTGRIKIGTEATCGFKNITISNCTFDNCRGLAIEQVDGGALEDVTITNITMRHIYNSPIFLRLGARLRGPQSDEAGTLQRIIISNVVVYDADPRYSSIISGIPGHDIADVQLHHIQIFCRGGGTKQWATTQSAENINSYPEPKMFGETGAYGFFIRHARAIDLQDIKLSYAQEEWRPPFSLNAVEGIKLTDIDARIPVGMPFASLQNTRNLDVRHCAGVDDKLVPSVENGAVEQISSNNQH